MSEDLNDLLVFMKVAQLGSFTKAGDKLGVPKSNISRKISRLEDQLGVRLLERSTRSLHLTEIGKVYFQHCLRIQEELDNAEQSLESLKTGVTGTLSVCASVGVGQYLLAPLVAEFKALQPQVKFALNFTNRRVDVIEEGVDLAIRVGESPDSNLISKKLKVINLSLYASKHYLEAATTYGSDITSIKDLSEHPCLYMDGIDGKPKWHLLEAEQEHYVEFIPEVIANDFYTLKTLAEEGLGIALLPTYMANKSKTLVKVLPECVGRTVNLYGIYPSRLGVTPKLRSFLEFLESSLN